MTYDKDELVQWLKESKSQWVFEEISKIRERYENKARQLTQTQKETLTRRLQLLSWGRIGSTKHSSIKNLKIIDGVDADIDLITHDNKNQALKNTFTKITEGGNHGGDPETVRALIIDELQACVYYKIKNEMTLILAVFTPENN